MKLANLRVKLIVAWVFWVVCGVCVLGYLAFGFTGDIPGRLIYGAMTVFFTFVMGTITDQHIREAEDMRNTYHRLKK